MSVCHSSPPSNCDLDSTFFRVAWDVINVAHHVFMVNANGNIAVNTFHTFSKVRLVIPSEL